MDPVTSFSSGIYFTGLATYTDTLEEWQVFIDSICSNLNSDRELEKNALCSLRSFITEQPPNRISIQDRIINILQGLEDSEIEALESSGISIPSSCENIWEVAKTCSLIEAAKKTVVNTYQEIGARTEVLWSLQNRLEKIGEFSRAGELYRSMLELHGYGCSHLLYCIATQDLMRENNYDQAIDVATSIPNQGTRDLALGILCTKLTELGRDVEANRAFQNILSENGRRTTQILVNRIMPPRNIAG